MNNPNDPGQSPFRRPVPLFGQSPAQYFDEVATDRPSQAEAPEVEQADAKDQYADVNGRVQLETVADGGTQQDDAAAGSDPYDLYPLSVDEIRSRLFALGISKSKDSIQRYCREGTLDCIKLGMLRRYYATEVSVEALIETLMNDAAASDSTQLHEGADSFTQLDTPLLAAVSSVPVAENDDRHEAASSGMQADAGASGGTQRDAAERAGAKVDADARRDEDRETARREHTDAVAEPGMVDFLKEQLKVKDEQIRVKDQQIAAMLERDRETNILIRGLQDRIGDAFGLLVSGTRRDDNRSSGNADANDDRNPDYRTIPVREASDDDPGGGQAVENGDGQKRWQ